MPSSRQPSSADGGFASVLHAHPLILAPMAGVSDSVFRRLCLRQGADLVYSEMISAKGLSHANEKTRHLIDLSDEERAVVVQLFGHEPQVMASQACWVEEQLGSRLIAIDVNMGCPARKIVTKGDGASLMTRPDEAFEIVKAISAAVSTPVTVKFRRGFALGEESCVDLARRLEQAGAAGFTVHGRYAQQFYRGRADWGAIARVKAAVTIPVVGNGDVRGPEDLRSMMRETGCDAVMIGRAAQGNPWIFAACKAALEHRPTPPPPTPFDRLAMARAHAALLAEIHGDRLVMMRAAAMNYVQGMPHAAEARRRLSGCTSFADFDAVFSAMEEQLSEQASIHSPEE